MYLGKWKYRLNSAVENFKKHLLDISEWLVFSPLVQSHSYWCTNKQCFGVGYRNSVEGRGEWGEIWSISGNWFKETRSSYFLSCWIFVDSSASGSPSPSVESRMIISWICSCLLLAQLFQTSKGIHEYLLVFSVTTNLSLWLHPCTDVTFPFFPYYFSEVTLMLFLPYPLLSGEQQKGQNETCILKSSHHILLEERWSHGKYFWTIENFLSLYMALTPALSGLRYSAVRIYTPMISVSSSRIFCNFLAYGCGLTLAGSSALCNHLFTLQVIRERELER